MMALALIALAGLRHALGLRTPEVRSAEFGGEPRTIETVLEV
jgi:hypothetical protein